MNNLRRLAKYLANLGYGTRAEMELAIKSGRIEGEGDLLCVDGVPADPAPGLVLILNKPAGYTCSHKEAGALVYDLLPPRFLRRNPQLNSVGRLDAATTGLLLFTDDGALLHRLTSPKYAHEKVYEVTLVRPMRGTEAALFASGALVLEDDDKPLKPALLEVLSETTARLTLTEGRYHQVRRMFAATGNQVESLHRSRFGALELGDLAIGTWRLLDHSERQVLDPPRIRSEKGKTDS